MSTAAVSWVIEHSKSSRSTRLVLMVMAEAASPTGENSRLAVETIRQRTGLSEATVHRSIRWLLDAGEVDLAGRQTGRGHVNVYSLPALKGATVTPFPSKKGSHKGAQDETLFDLQAPERVSSASVKGLTMTPEPSTEPSTKKNTSNPDGFDEWWTAYPRKEAKPRAIKAYASAIKTTAPPVILSGLRGYTFSPERRYTPLPATWLNDRRWEDEPVSEHPNQKTDDPNLRRFQ